MTTNCKEKKILKVLKLVTSLIEQNSFKRNKTKDLWSKCKIKHERKNPRVHSYTFSPHGSDHVIIHHHYKNVNAQ